MSKIHGQEGLSLVEALVVLTIAGLAIGATSLYLAPAEAPLITGTTILEGTFRQARLKAIATTSAYRVKPILNYRMIAETAVSCASTTWTEDPEMRVILPDKVTLDDVTWSVCFSSRGVSSDNVTIGLSHPHFGSKQIEVLLGGTTRVIE